ncbi:MAG TPA: glycogen synthase GlgA [Bryobacteraceae bacterium]|nr:glycogen synthase GlgA [Bryobacteraceae bacterium]
MNILFVASEATPFAKTGGLADVIGSLPAALAARGERVAVVLPAYRENVYPAAPGEAFRSLAIPLGAGYSVRIAQTSGRGVDFYFVECPPLYDRDGIYGHSDDYLRFGVLCMAALGVARNLFLPDIIHCHDWQTGLLPVYLRENFGGDPTFAGVKTLFTIHNLGYQGQFGPETLAPLGLDPRWFNPSQLEFFGHVNLLKAGIAWSDALSTVSPTYAREIQTREYGFGLDGFLAGHGPVEGILNGADYEHWDPEHDPHIARHFSVDDLRGKRECKRQLIAEMGLPSDTLDRPLIGIVSRFAAQKGFDLIAETGSRLLAEDVALAVLGSGETGYQDMFRSLAQTYPRKVGLRIGYDNAVSHRIEAGADMFLMPSRYEPCGLNQMYSLRYGTVPVVRATGGLDDTIDEATGFKFRDYSGTALLGAIGLALKAYRDPGRWTNRMRAGMRKDFSWNASATEYLRLYRRLKGV